MSPKSPTCAARSLEVPSSEAQSPEVQPLKVRSREEQFLACRNKLRAVAYRMLGSATEADDVLQDAYLRWHRTGVDVESAEAWLVTTVSRLCLDRLKSARAQREVYVGPWLPEPLPTEPDEVDIESISSAFLVLLERLSPVERAAYLLHSVFEYDYRAVSRILDKSEPAVRQACHRARGHISAGKPRFAASPTRHAELLDAFLEACIAPDPSALKGLLVADVRATTDGGGVVNAALKTINGADAVARFFWHLARKQDLTTTRVARRKINGWPSLVFSQEGIAFAVLHIETDGTTIHQVHTVLNPQKLVAVRES